MVKSSRGIKGLLLYKVGDTSPSYSRVVEFLERAFVTFMLTREMLTMDKLSNHYAIWKFIFPGKVTARALEREDEKGVNSEKLQAEGGEKSCLYRAMERNKRRKEDEPKNIGEYSKNVPRGIKCLL